MHHDLQPAREAATIPETCRGRAIDGWTPAVKHFTVKCFTAIVRLPADTRDSRRRTTMRQATTTRETLCGWVVASGIGIAVIALFVTAIVMGNPDVSGAAEVKPDVPELLAPDLPRE
jgi:hypothetical protein